MPPASSTRNPAVGDLAVTLLPESIGFWLPRPADDYSGLTRAVRQVLGDSTAVPIDHSLDQIQLDTTGSRLFDNQVQAAVVGLDEIIDGLGGRRTNQNWSPTVAWLHEATVLAERIVRAGRVFPTVRPLGLRWSATWSVVADSDVDEQIEWLLVGAPPVLFAGAEQTEFEQTFDLLNGFVDAIARNRLTDQGWRAPLARSRSTAVIALRRIVTALTSPDRVFIGDSPAHEMVYAEWSTASSAAASILAGGPVVSFRARLVPPDVDDHGTSWTLGFEVVGPKGETATFGDVWGGTVEASGVVDADAITTLRVRMRELIDRLTGQLAAFEPLIDESEPTELVLDIDDVTDLLDQSLLACRRAGLPIVVPASLERRDARLTARATSGNELPTHTTPRSGLISVDWGVALGDLELSEAELQMLADSKAEIVALRGAWVQVDQRQISGMVDEQHRRQIEAGELSASELLRESISAFGQGDDFSAEGWIATLLAGLPDDELTEAFEPAGFVGELRPYQRRALGWLQFLGRLGLGGCLADDMGLGKTPTALAHLLERTLGMVDSDEDNRPHLVVCPLSVVTNWAAESARFTPELSVMVAHGPNRAQGEDLVEQVQKHDIVITTYGTAPRIAEELGTVVWDVVVFDEAQAIKNHTTNAAQSVREFHAVQKIALTGTPVENRLTELWSILDALNPGMLGGITWFRTNLANPIETTGDPDKIEALKGITAPFVLRRTKADRSLVPDLPPKIEHVEWATLTAEQAGLYQAVVDDFFEQLAEASGMERRGLVLATLTKLKQVCNHPAHFLRESEVGSDRSGKLDRFDELIETITASDEKALVFTQYRQMGLLLAHHLNERHRIEAPFLHGGTPRAQRDRMVELFQSEAGPPIQLVSLRAGGTGLNLTAASRVIHYDRWWNPAVEDQATDRTWRIGQTQTVFVHKLVCQGTLEDRIDALLTQKRVLAEAVVSSGDKWLTELSTDELRSLVRLEPDLGGSE